MNLYLGTKLIKATLMTRLEYNLLRGWELPADEEGSDTGYLVEYFDGGKANHPDYTGYISWSPEEVFNNAYKESGKLTFGMAVELLKQGYKVARSGWNGKDMFVYYVPSRTEENHGSECLDIPYIYYREYLALKTAQGDIATWAPSTSDALAEDWCIVE